MKRIHPNQAEAIANSLWAICKNKRRASRVLERCVEAHPKWGARDRNLLYTATYDILRWKRLYQFYADLDDADFLPWGGLKCWLILNEYSIPEWKELEQLSLTSKMDMLAKELPSPSIKYAFPDWLYALGQKELGSAWEKEVAGLNTQARVSLRVNRLLASPKRIKEELEKKYNIISEYKAKYPDALLLNKGKKLSTNRLFKQGYFEVQDAHSQEIAHFCQVAPNMDVIDLCAGAGGKTLHLAALMRNKGRLRAYDIESPKLNELKRRAKRAKVKIIQTECILPNSDLEHCRQWADCVLVDAPCSGLGTLKRNPEIKWNLNETQLNALIETQRSLLKQAADYIKPGGTIVYATCSILPSENQNQVDQFLRQNNTFTLDESINISSQNTPFDGFFMARLKKKS
ncbi:MAG: RsmB/NOP family class I SAM-dependent RNA methyltransferase [Flavobacteriaceae bacterium]